MIADLLIVLVVLPFILGGIAGAREDARDNRRRRIERGYTTDLRKAYPAKSDVDILLEAIGL